MIFMGISNYIAQYGMGKTSQNVVLQIRNDIFSKLQDMSLGYFDTRPSGDILSIATNDVDQLNQLVGGQFVSIISSIVSIALSIVFMYFLNPLLATISLIIFPIFYLMQRIFRKVIIGVFKESRKSISKVTSSIQENIAGAKVVQAYGQEDKATSEFDVANKENYDVMLRIRRIMATFFPFVSFVTTVITASIIVLGGFAVLGNVSILGTVISVGVLSAFITILAQFFRPFMTIMQIQQIIESALAATDRIQSLLEESVEIPDAEKPEELADVKGTVQFSDVSFGYRVSDANGEPKKPMSPMEKMMAQNPMMKRAIDAVKSWPEPYSSFVMKNLMKMPQDIRMKLFMGLMGTSPSAAPKKIDKILAEFEYAVPTTEMAKKHPEYKTRFRRQKGQMPPMMPGMPPGGPPSMSAGGPPMGGPPMAMMKRAMDAIKAFPEPYSSFVMKNMMSMPQNVRRKLMMGVMGVNPADIPQKIDKILSEFEIAVPDTEMAKQHPEYKTSFGDKPSMPPMMPGTPLKAQKPPTPEKESSSMPMGGMMPSDPNMINMMAKGLERMLSPSAGGGGGMGGMMGGGGGGMPQMNAPDLARMLASMNVPPEIYDDFPKVVKDYIDEQKMLMEREQMRGYVLENINLNIDAGTTLAIVGETGAGKTTAIKLIARFYDINKGAISIDGVDIRKVPKKDLRDLIGLVPQDAFIFTGTIKDNLLYAFEEVTPEIEEKMIEISKFLGLHNFIDTLHKKYDTKLKENGSNISIGQRQLIAFARALLTDPKILILDEATSSVDPYTETLIQDALDKAREGRTTIIIAHRLSTIKNADHIIVIGKEKHGILEEGSHDKLMAQNGAYKHLVEMQHRDID